MCTEDTVSDFLLTNKIPFEENISLSTKTWIKRGGITRFYIVPNTADQVKSVISFFYSNQVQYHIVGQTSNLYFLNSYNPFAVISCSNLTKSEETDEYIYCECGVNVTKIAREMGKNGFDGFDGLVGLPGTIGGAVVNNSSAFGYSINKLALEIRCLNQSGAEEILTSADLNLKTRSSAIKRKEKNLFVLGVKLNKKKSENANFHSNSTHYLNLRNSLQSEKSMNLGSCFKLLQKSLPLKILLTIRFLVRTAIRVFCSKETQKKRLERNVFFSLAGFPSLSHYVDAIQPNCFIWRDEKADDVFFNQYLPFMKKYYKAEDLEIEILGK
ncbi:MAG: FAD-binding protein [Paludibacteraceae bacterium]|nr:FAD-binding protein [Paludibacteraceae bacterium]